MTRVIYFSRDYTTHDYRFLSALAKTQYEIFFLRLERRHPQLEDRPLPSGVSQVSWIGGKRASNFYDGPRLLIDLSRVINRFNPDLIHAGPLQSSAFLVALSGFKPLISMSWGYDLLQDANRNMLWHNSHVAPQLQPFGALISTMYGLVGGTNLFLTVSPLRYCSVTYCPIMVKSGRNPLCGR